MAEYVWTGSAWTLSPQKKIWNGSSWIEVKGAKVWNGSVWKEYLNASITSGSDAIFFGGGKGTEGYTTTFNGFSSFEPYGSVDGDIRGYPVLECYWSTTIYEISPQEWQFVVNVTGDISGTAYSVMIDGTVVTNAKTGSYSSGPNSTLFQWMYTAGGSGDTIPATNPFGADGTISNVQLV